MGNLKKILSEKINIQKKFIAKNLKLNLKVLGISNSKRMVISDSEIDLNNWYKLLDESKLKAVESVHPKIG